MTRFLVKVVLVLLRLGVTVLGLAGFVLMLNQNVVLGLVVVVVIVAVLWALRKADNWHWLHPRSELEDRGKH